MSKWYLLQMIQNGIVGEDPASWHSKLSKKDIRELSYKIKVIRESDPSEIENLPQYAKDRGFE